MLNNLKVPIIQTFEFSSFFNDLKIQIFSNSKIQRFKNINKYLNIHTVTVIIFLYILFINFINLLSVHTKILYK